MTAKLYVGNLSFQTTEAEVRRLFAEFGAVRSAQLIVDRATGLSKGFAFVEMDSPALAHAAARNLNGRRVGGRPLNVRPAEARPLPGPRRPAPALRRAPRKRPPPLGRRLRKPRPGADKGTGEPTP